MLTVLIGLALIPFAIVGIVILVVGAWYLRWIIIVLFVAVALFIGIYLDKQNNESAARREKNLPLYNKCIENIEQNKRSLYFKAYQEGRATQSYNDRLNLAENTAKSRCMTKYPTY